MVDHNDEVLGNNITHIERLEKLGNKLVTNLNTMGVNAKFSDGALTLADKILNISTMQFEVLLSISVPSEVKIDEQINITGYANCYYEDTYLNISDEPLANKEITIRVDYKTDGYESIKYATTNSQGRFSVSVTPLEPGDVVIEASLDEPSNSNYESAVSPPKTVTIGKYDVDFINESTLDSSTFTLKLKLKNRETGNLLTNTPFSVELYEYNRSKEILFDDAHTNENGEWSFLIPRNIYDTDIVGYTLYCHYEGDELHQSSNYTTIL